MHILFLPPNMTERAQHSRAHTARILRHIVIVKWKGDTMARQVITVLTDDIDGGDADRTVEFGLDGVTYTIDLSDKNAGKLRNALNPYLSVASRVGRSGAGGRIASRNTAAAPSRSNREQNQAIREWAAKNGYEVSERGRIPSSIVEAFHSKR